MTGREEVTIMIQWHRGPSPPETPERLVRLFIGGLPCLDVSHLFFPEHFNMHVHPQLIWEVPRPRQQQRAQSRQLRGAQRYGWDDGTPVTKLSARLCPERVVYFVHAHRSIFSLPPQDGRSSSKEGGGDCKARQSHEDGQGMDRSSNLS